MINFPKKHIADSVAERILAVERRLNANHVDVQGQKLTEALAQPPGEMAPLEGIDQALVGRALDL